MISTNRNKLKSLQKRILQLDKTLTLIENTVSIISFTAMCILVIVGVASRFIFHIPFMWLEEASRYFMVAGVYVGVSMGIREKAHLGLTVIIDSLPMNWRKVITMSLNAITVLLCLYFAFYSVSFMQQVHSNGQSSPALRFPMWVVYIPISVGFLFGAIRSMMCFWNDYICKTPVLSYGDDEVQLS